MIYGHEEVMNHLLSRVVFPCEFRMHKAPKVLKSGSKDTNSIYATAKVILFQHLYNINIHCQLNKKGYKTNIEKALIT